MIEFGVTTTVTEESLQPVELATLLENEGIDALMFGEHSHIPVEEDASSPLNDEMPEFYKHFSDPFISMTAAASATKKLKVGTSVLLLPEHNAISLAKQISSLDRFCDGRLILGVGAGWNAQELHNHGIDWKDRWPVTCETISAMRNIWTQDQAEYHGKFVDFNPLWSYPKPVQAGGPPILMGACSSFTAKRVARYCDGWVPLDGWGDIPAVMSDIKEECKKAERDFDTLQLSVITIYRLEEGRAIYSRIDELLEMGFTQILLPLNPELNREEQIERLAMFSEVFKTFR